MPRKKKIAVVVPKYGLVGGGERFVRELTERIARNATYDIHVLANRWQSGSSRITFHRIPIVTFPKWLTTISFAWFVQRKLKNLKPDIVHAHDRIFRADVVTVHSIPHRTWVKEVRRKRIPSLFDLATSWVEKRMFEKSDCKKVLPVSTLAAEKLCEAYPSVRDKVEVIAPGVDLTRFGQVQPDWRQSVRQEFGIGPDDFLVLFVGMNFELKGLEPLIRAVALAQKQLTIKKVSLLVVGKGDVDRFQEVANGLGIGAHVFFAGVRKDMERIYQAGDVFCLLSQFDTFGMVVTEAMATGLPVIVSNNVGASDLIREGKNGFVVSSEWNTGRIVAEIVDLASNDEKRAAMSYEAKQTASGQSWTKVAAKVEAVYERLLRGHGGYLYEKGAYLRNYWARW